MLELADLLTEERAAALSADFDALEALQEKKREVLDRIAEHGPKEGPEFRRLGEVARANVGLIRHLVVLTRALTGADAAGYGADGKERSNGAPRNRRGVG